ncbi:MAG: response regulator [Desulfobacteraceae bacterium]|nr:response regulator [Desulfobacteraceae bacterium]
MMTKIPTILVVDDEKDFCHFARFNLEISGRYKVHTANTGQRALELAVKITPDLILLDIMMPEMDGFEVLRALKESLQTAAIPVVMLTALEQDIPRVLAGEGYAQDYLVKPIRSKDLMAKIEDTLAFRRP